MRNVRETDAVTECVCDYDPASVYEAVDRIARKQHRCYECGRPIWPGEAYEKVFGIWYDEGPQTFKTCVRCLALREFVQSNVKCFCWAHGNVIDDALETARHYHEQGNGLLFGAYRRYVAIQRNTRIQ